MAEHSARHTPQEASGTTPDGSLAALAEANIHADALERQVRSSRDAANEARAMFREAPQAAFVLSAEGRLLEVNARGAALLGSSGPLLTGRPLASLLRSCWTADPRPVTLTTLLAAVFRGLGRQAAQVQVCCPDGRQLTLVLEAALFVRQDGRRVCQLSATDITVLQATPD